MFMFFSISGFQNYKEWVKTIYNKHTKKELALVTAPQCRHAYPLVKYSVPACSRKNSTIKISQKTSQQVIKTAIQKHTCNLTRSR